MRKILLINRKSDIERGKISRDCRLLITPIIIYQGRRSLYGTRVSPPKNAQNHALILPSYKDSSKYLNKKQLYFFNFCDIAQTSLHTSLHTSPQFTISLQISSQISLQTSLKLLQILSRISLLLFFISNIASFTSLCLCLPLTLLACCAIESIAA